MSPFRYGCIVEGENFCPRPTLKGQLRDLLKGGQNVVIQGAHRIGKTSLVYDAAHSVRGMRILYIDLFCVRTLGDACRRVVEAASRCGEGESFRDRVTSLVRPFRPMLTTDNTTGLPILTIDARMVKDVSAVEVVMDLLVKVASENRCCIVLDSFQDIMDLPESESVLPRFRAWIPRFVGVPLVFIVGVRDSLYRIFGSPRGPFFKSAICFSVDRINQDEFGHFLISRFKVGDRMLSLDIAKKIIERADGVPGDVQELCEAIWLATEDGAKITAADIENGLLSVLARENSSFSAMKSRLTTDQLSLLQGVAMSETANVRSPSFLEDNDIKDVASAETALSGLLREEYLFGYDGAYRFENPFFRARILRDIGESTLPQMEILL